MSILRNLVPISIIIASVITVSSASGNNGSLLLQTYPDFYYNNCSNKDGGCPPGLFCVDGHCECGVYPEGGIIQCSGGCGSSVQVLKIYCATFDLERNLTSVNVCLNRIPSDKLYYTLPRNAGILNDLTCSYLHRTGVVCGTCFIDFSPMAYSTDLHCIICQNANRNWFWYSMAAYVPLTFFCFFILFFSVLCSATCTGNTNHHVFALVYCCQIMSAPFQQRVFFSYLQSRNFSYMNMARVVMSFHGMWGLDFFKPFYSLCLGIGIFPTLALEYGIAVYSLQIVITALFLAALHNRGYRVVTVPCRPFREMITAHCRGGCDLRKSVIDASAMLFFLSSIKFVNVSFDLLNRTVVYKLFPNTSTSGYVPTFSGSMEYFGSEHLPYALLAMGVLCVLIFLPAAILAFHPFTFFKRFFPGHWYILSTFISSFQSCFKDGSEPGTRDYRWFASVFFAFHVVQSCIFSLFDSSRSDAFFLSWIVLSVSLITALIAVLQPFKSPHNVITAVFLHILALTSAGGVLFISSVPTASCFSVYILALGAFVAAFPLFYAVVILCYWCYMRRQRAEQRNGYEELSPESTAAVINYANH